MPDRRAQAFDSACAWLGALVIPADDVERHILRIFALSIAGATPEELRRCSQAIFSFPWFHYTGDPVPALLAHRALVSAGCALPSLEALERGYRSLLSPDEEPLPLLCDLLGVDAPVVSFTLPAPTTLFDAAREEILEVCRRVAMVTSCGVRPIQAGDTSVMLPALATSYARDWDLEVTCALLRASCYLRLPDSPTRQWCIAWLLDQQNSDGRFGLLRAEAARCGWDPADWRLYFDRTVHALWALSATSDYGRA